MSGLSARSSRRESPEKQFYIFFKFLDGTYCAKLAFVIYAEHDVVEALPLTNRLESDREADEFGNEAGKVHADNSRFQALNRHRTSDDELGLLH